VQVFIFSIHYLNQALSPTPLSNPTPINQSPNHWLTSPS
jgi:hypothetical protein